ncbi:SGNH/GDSL hydrolase family protein [Pedobacter chitinilyticus]|uniref:T9SS type A sorting domain-containing protein n=1 Tax=Pedobacter chitinilyticus TaxID=2233776 RepID=A0A443YUV6_9SPHI|nr:SGNH/GDSL hydrolase family protein [Pedobacter chitinilyticus]RWU07567.1 T9SS type A sorting domain-containing protein [Pedobacter chitinilyticus]
MKLLIPALFYIFLIGISFDAEAQSMGVSCPESAQYYSKDSINVITFGASTVEGVKGLEFQSYLTQNFIKCYTNKAIRIEKYGVGGETTGQSLPRLNAAISGKTGFIVIMVGVNDAVRIEAGRQSIAETEANMRQIINISLSQRLIPIVCTLQFFDDRNNPRSRRVNTVITQINTLYKRIVQEKVVYLADVNRVFRRDFSLYQDDVHPNARGYRLISYVIFDTINKIIAERFLQFTVSQNYPNPAINGYTSIDIVMPESDKIELKIYSIQGKLMATPINEYLNTGKHVVKLNLSQFPAGVYICKITSSSGLYTATKKLIVR